MTHDSIIESALLRAMTLLATLSTAVEVKTGMKERKAGRDPSAQEFEDIVRPLLIDSGETARSILLQLRASLVVGDGHLEDPFAGQVRRFSELQQWRRLSRLFQQAHQRLLSLYPAASEILVEQARAMYARTDALIGIAGEKNYREEAGAFIDEAMNFCSRLLRELDPIPPQRR